MLRDQMQPTTHRILIELLVRWLMDSVVDLTQTPEQSLQADLERIVCNHFGPRIYRVISSISVYDFSETERLQDYPLEH